MKIVLGSQSPRRSEILGYFNLPFRQISSGFDEDSVSIKNKSPQQYALELASKKGELLSFSLPNQLILTADTIVVCEGKIFNKPLNDVEGIEFLMSLSGKWHSVWTALALTQDRLQWTEIEETKVLFHSITQKQAREYQKHFVFTDKAGGYAIQNCGSILVDKIEGSYHNVMGLPINALRKILLNIQIDLWDYLKAF